MTVIRKELLTTSGAVGQADLRYAVSGLWAVKRWGVVCQAWEACPSMPLPRFPRKWKPPWELASNIRSIPR